jgi:hypothetical protein
LGRLGRGGSQAIQASWAFLTRAEEKMLQPKASIFVMREDVQNAAANQTVQEQTGTVFYSGIGNLRTRNPR